MSKKLFAVLLGGRSPGYTIEQHNVFFGVGETLEDLYPAIKQFWSAVPKIHIDAYMVIDKIGDHDVVLLRKGTSTDVWKDLRLFFVNLGGYRKGEFEEIHKKIFILARDGLHASMLARLDPFFKKGVQQGQAVPHIDDKHILGELEDDAPVDVGTLVAPQGYAIRLKEVRSGSSVYPKPVITGFLRIPEDK